MSKLPPQENRNTPKRQAPSKSLERVERHKRELRQLEREGRIAVRVSGPSDNPMFEVEHLHPTDPVIAELQDLHGRISKLLATESISPWVRVPLEAAQFALIKAALLAGSLPVPGHDPKALHTRLVALARVALRGREPNEAGLRAQVHDMLLGVAITTEFGTFSQAQQRAASKVVASTLPAYAGTTRSVDPSVVMAALRQIESNDGRPRGAKTNGIPTVPQAQEKWETLHVLLKALGIPGSTPDALRRELSKTKKEATMPQSLRDV